MNPTVWMRNLLRSRGLEVPDGRPLYQYRVTDIEFDELGRLIQLTSNFGVAHTISMLSWDAIFAMYAAEWWRRCFSGKWGWEQVFQSVNIDFHELPVGSRNSLMESGLNRWHRKVRIKNGSRRFLGTIATEGGLPLHKLVESGGWLKRVLQPTVRRHIAKGHSISALIEAHSFLIPVSLWSEEIADILEDVVQAIVDLRAQHDLGHKDAPVKWLDECIPSWREDFPLPLDDDAARSLLEDLVDVASKTAVEQNSTNPFEMTRILVRAETPASELIAEIDMPGFVSLESLKLDPYQVALPSLIDVEVVGSNNFCKRWCRGVLTTFQNKRSYKLSGSNFKIEGQASTGHFFINFKSMGEIIGEMAILNAETLSSDVPWTFKKIDERWTLHGTASQSIRNDEAIVYCPKTYEIQSNKESHLARLSDFMTGVLWKLQGSATCFEGLNKYEIKTASKESTISYRLSGKYFPFESDPRIVFIGKPRVLEIDSLTGHVRKSFHGRVLVRKCGAASDETWRSIESVDTGVYQIRIFDADTNILFSQTVGILAEDYKHYIQPSADDPLNGALSITGITFNEMECIAEGVSIRSSIIDSGKEFSLRAGNEPPKSVEISILPAGQSHSLILTYPFPRRGAMLFDSKNHQVPAEKYIYLNHLPGHRLRIFNDKTHLAERFSLTLSLRDPALSRAEARDLFIVRQMKLYGDYIELSVSDWTTAITTLFGASRSIDAHVGVALTLNDKPLYQFNIRRYEQSMALNFSDGVVELTTESLSDTSSEMLDATQVLALPLDMPNQEPEVLICRQTQGVHVGAWEFDSSKKRPGPWIIYPSAESPLAFRPAVWTVTQQNDTPIINNADPGTVEEIVGIKDISTRHESLRLCLEAMATSFTHPAWNYIDALWEKTNHLPLACFDIWQLASQTPSFLAALLVRNQLEILEKLDSEFPVIWEIVPQRVWESTLKAYHIKLMTQLEGDETFADRLIGTAIERIGAQSPSLLSMELNLLGVVRGIHSPEIGVMSHPVTEFVRPQLLNEYQRLLQRQANSEWPQLLGQKLIRIYESLPNQFRQIVVPHNAWQRPIVHLPFVLAWHAIFGDQDDLCNSPADVFKLQQLKQFDEDWFDVAFKFISGWLSQQESVE